MERSDLLASLDKHSYPSCGWRRGVAAKWPFEPLPSMSSWVLGETVQFVLGFGNGEREDLSAGRIQPFPSPTECLDECHDGNKLTAMYL
jgi:hypothetical protein